MQVRIHFSIKNQVIHNGWVSTGKHPDHLFNIPSIQNVALNEHWCEYIHGIFNDTFMRKMDSEFHHGTLVCTENEKQHSY